MAFFRKKQEDNSELNFRAKRRAILSENSDFSVKEAYKTLRTNIRFSLADSGCKKLCVTSGLPSEGKSITVLNVAISFAETGQRVLLVDADLRRPTLARLLIENGDPGLSNVLAGMCSEEDAIRSTQYANLDVIYSGVIPPNPSELLSSPRMEKLLESLAKKYDYIFFDTPPVNVVTDACVVAPLLDGVLFVVRQNRSERDTVSKGVHQLEIAGSKILGFVLNGVVENKSRKYSRYDRYGYYRYEYRTNDRSRVQTKTATGAKLAQPKATATKK